MSNAIIFVDDKHLSREQVKMVNGLLRGCQLDFKQKTLQKQQKQGYIDNFITAFDKSHVKNIRAYKYLKYHTIYFTLTTSGLSGSTDDPKVYPLFGFAPGYLSGEKENEDEIEESEEDNVVDIPFVGNTSLTDYGDSLDQHGYLVRTVDSSAEQNQISYVALDDTAKEYYVYCYFFFEEI